MSINQSSSRSNKPSKLTAKSLSFDRFSIQGAVLAIILAMIVIVPLLSGTEYLKNLGKPAAFEILGCLLLAVMGSQITFNADAMRALMLRLKVGPTLPIILLFAYAVILYLFLPSMFSTDPIEQYRSFHRMELAELFRIFFCGLVYVATALYLQGVGRLQLIIDVLLGVAVAVSLVSFYTIGNSHVDIRVTGTFGTPETLGSFLLFVLPIALCVALTDLGNQKRQIAAQVVTLIIAAALLMAHARSAWLGSAVALFVLSVLYYFFVAEKNKTMSSSQRAAMLVGPPVIMFASIALFLLTSQQGGAIANRVKTVGNLHNDVSANIRSQMRSGTIAMIRQEPIVGWGPGTYPMRSYSYTHYGQSAADINKNGLTLDNNAHSFYLQFTAEEGLIGMALFLSIPLLFLITSAGALRNMPKGLPKIVVIGTMAACIGQLVDSAISPSYNLPAISMFQFLIFGIGTLAARGLYLPTATSTTVDGGGKRVRRRVSSRDDERLTKHVRN